MIAVLIAGDPWFPLDARNRAERIMIDTELKYHMQVFSGVNHGFALRGNMDDPAESKHCLYIFHLNKRLTDRSIQGGPKRSVLEPL